MYFIIFFFKETIQNMQSKYGSIEAVASKHWYLVYNRRGGHNSKIIYDFIKRKVVQFYSYYLKNIALLLEVY